MILLDGDSHFAHTTAAVEFLARNQRIPAMFVVGVLNTNRERDLTPPVKGKSLPNHGSDKFLAFIGDELIPEIDRTYRTRPYRVIIGHSLGGLFAVYALTERPELFDAYLPISPSLWVDDQALVKDAEAFFTKNTELRKDVYMTMGNEGNTMLGGFWKLSALLEEKKPKDLRWQIKRSPDETHGSIPYRSTYDGLEALFEGWYIRDPVSVYEQGGVSAIDKHFKKVSERMGYAVPMTTNSFVPVLQMLNQQKRYDEAEVLVKHVLVDYPNHPQPHFELARIYANKKDQENARAEFSKVIELYPGFMQARMMLTAAKGTPPQDMKLSDAAMKALVGEYRGPEDSAFVSIKDNQLSITSPVGSCELRALSESRLYCVNADIEFTVNKEKGGRIASLVVEYGDYQTTRTKVRAKGK